MTFNLRYPGQYYDQETGLHYNWHRSYDAGRGRYTQADPIGLDGGWNRFGYASANALSNTDPLGLFTWLDGSLALNNYCYGLGMNWTTDLNDINLGNANQNIKKTINKIISSQTGGVCKDGQLGINEIISIDTGGADTYIIGQHNLKVFGTVNLKCDCSWTFSGSAVSASGVDLYNMNQAARSPFKESLTSIARESCQFTSKPFLIYVKGAKPIELQGKIPGASSGQCCSN